MNSIRSTPYVYAHSDGKVQIVDVSFQIRDVGSEKVGLDVSRRSRCGESAGSEEREEEAPRQKQLLIGW